MRETSQFYLNMSLECLEEGYNQRTGVYAYLIAQRKFVSWILERGVAFEKFKRVETLISSFIL